MPIYEYRCANGHLFDVMQRMSDDPLTACIECGASVQKVLNAPAIHFKGSGFYNTDYGRGNGSKPSDGAEGGKGGEGGKAGKAGDTAAPTTAGSKSSDSSSGSSGSSTGSGSSPSGGSSSSKSD